MAMADETCINCGRTDQETPLLAWRFQGQSLWVCAGCIPHLIHHTETVLVRVKAMNRAQQPAPTGKQGE